VNADVHQVLFDPGSGLALAASGRGLAVSADGGESWKFDAEGLHGTYLRAVAVVGATVLVAASTGHQTRQAAVYRASLAGGRRFERCASGLPEWFPDNIDTFCLAAAGQQAAFGTSDGRVYASSDEGRSWSVAAEGLAPVRCVSIVA
jgi:hypothetical protein